MAYDNDVISLTESPTINFGNHDTKVLRLKINKNCPELS